MKLFREKNRQQAFFRLAACIAIFIIIIIFFDFLIYRDYNKQVSLVMAEMISKIKEAYPDVKEETLVHILNQKSQKGEVDLSDFGIEKDTINVIQSMESCFYRSLLLSFLLFFSFVILAVILFFLYFKKENKKIEEIIEYIDAINRKNYKLCLLENEEGAISHLKNELYKITVMLREQADQSKKEKEQVKESMADISHQMKTPITSVLIMLDNLRENQEMPLELRQKFLTEINRQILWIQSLIISMLKLSRLEASVVEFKREKIYLYEFFQEMKENLSIMIEARCVTVIISENKEAYFFGDRYWEREAMINLLKNSIEHTIEGTTIEISFEQNYFYTKIAIKDQGEGMEMEEQKRIFERFYRGEHTKHGVGIGLSLAKKIIENDYGRVRVSSKKGEGTVFEIVYSNQ